MRHADTTLLVCEPADLDGVWPCIMHKNPTCMMQFQMQTTFAILLQILPSKTDSITCMP